MYPNDADGVAYIDKISPSEQSDLNWQCLLSSIFPQNVYGIVLIVCAGEEI